MPYDMYFNSFFKLFRSTTKLIRRQYKFFSLICGNT